MAPDAGWIEANRRYFMAALGVVRCHLQRELGEPASAARAALSAAEAQLVAPPAIQLIQDAFRLSRFERDVLLACAGIEVDAAFAAACAAAHGDPARSRPTFALLLAALPEAHWSAVGPAGPLRRHGLIEVAAGPGLVQSPLSIDERVLHYLVGVDQPDQRLAGLIERAWPSAAPPPSQQAIADRIAAAWQGAAALGELPAVELTGPDRSAKLDIAAAACSAIGLRLDVLAATASSATLDDPALARLIARETVLGGSGLLLDCEDLDEHRDPARWLAVRRFADRFDGPLVVASQARLRPARRPTIAFDISRPTRDEQRALWREALSAARVAPSGAELDGLIEPLVATFDLRAPSIQAACAEGAAGEPGGGLPAALWEACRKQARPALSDLASRVPVKAGWDDLVLPAPQREALREIAIHVRRRAEVYEAWGFARTQARGLGVSALFAGPSGTGKTLAAEVLAAELSLDLYRVDLSQVVSKYIGETEKNLRRVFDAADEGAAILLFDEADALFGRRTRVTDSHDRHANVEVAYLLQRMEAYRGLSILTTNLIDALDQAFLRRIRFIVELPFPDEATRAEIWRRVFPPEAPLDGVDFARLARWNVAGGAIRNIALGAAFLAAEDRSPVRMSHLIAAARGEYRKLGRPLPEAETAESPMLTDQLRGKAGLDVDVS